MQKFSLTVPVQLLAAAGEKPSRLSIVAYTGGLVRPVGWPYDCVVNLAALDLPASVPILANHDNNISSVIAYGQPRTDGKSLTIVAKLVDSEAADAVRALIQSGAQLQASIGCGVVSETPLKVGDDVRANGQTIRIERPAVLASGTLREISVIPVAADGGTSVRLVAKGASFMEPTTTPPAQTQPASSIDVALQAQREAYAADARRATEIKQLCAGRHPEIESKGIMEGWTFDQTRAAVLHAEYMRLGNGRDGQAPLTIVRGSSLDTAMNSGSSVSQILAAGVLIRAGMSTVAEKHLGERATQAAADLRCTSMMDICKASLTMSHQDIPIGKNETIKAALSTVSLPNALADALGKIALDAYRDSPATWRSFARVGNSSDFKPQKLIRLVVGGNYEKVGGGGELKYGTLEDEAFTVQIDTHGRLFGITRTDIINDDLQLVSDLSRLLGRMGIRNIADLVYKTLLANKEPDGSTDFFAAGRGNYITGSDKILSINGLSAGREAMRKMKDAKGNTIDIAPRTLVVSPENETTARQILGSESVSRAAANDQQPTGNPFAGTGELGLEVEPRLSNSTYTGYSAAAWYLFSSPSDGAVAVNFLDGRDAPTVEQSEAPFNTLGIQFRGYIDFGVSLADYRAALKSKGAA